MSDNKKNKRLILISRLLFVVYIIAALYILLFSGEFGRTEFKRFSYNLEPFKEIQRYIDWANRDSDGVKWMLLNVWGNVLIFVPLGFFVPIVFSKIKNFFVVVLIGFGFSIVIEGVQLFTGVGSFDIDDIMLNTIGGIVGYIVYYVAHIVGKVIRR